MVGAEHLFTGLSRQSDGIEVVMRIDQVSTLRIVRDVPGRYCCTDMLPRANQQPAAFARRFRPCVFEDGGDDAIGNRHTSMTIAMPIPPPMHNAAIPRPPPRRRSA